MRESTSSKVFDEDGKINYRNDLIIQCNDTATNEWKIERKEKWENNKHRQEVNKERKNKKNIEKKFLKKKKYSETMMFEIVDVKNSNVKIFIKYYIDDIMTILNNFTKKFFEFINFLKKENVVQTYAHEKKLKKNSKENENESFEKAKKKKTNKWIFFLCLIFI